MVSINSSNNANYKIIYKGNIYDITDDINWRETDIEKDRDVLLSGISYLTSSNVSFFGTTAKILFDIYKESGIDAEVGLFISYPNYSDIKIGYLDFYEFYEQDNKCFLKVSDRGYLSKLQSNIDKNLNINIEEDINGNKIDKVNFDKTILKSRGINLITEYKKTNESLFNEVYNWNTNEFFYHYIPDLYPRNGDFNTSGGAEFKGRGILGLNLNIYNNFDEFAYNQNSIGGFESEFYNNVYFSFVINGIKLTKSVGGTFFKNDSNSIINISFQTKLKSKFRYIFKRQNWWNPNVEAVRVKFKIRVAKYLIDNTSNESLVFIEEFVLNEKTLDLYYLNSKYVDFDINTNLNVGLNPKELLSLEYTTEVEAKKSYGSSWYYPSVTTYEGGVFTEVFSELDGNESKGIYFENSYVKISRIKKSLDSIINSITLKNLIKRYLELIGIRNFKSDILDTKLKNYIIANGYMLRKMHSDDNIYDITTSLKSILNSVINIFGLGYGVEIINNVEFFVLEDRKYFYSDDVFDVSGVSKVVRIEPFKDIFFNSVKAGYNYPKSNSDYGDNKGLDEFNINSEYSTSIKTKVNNLVLMSDIRADSLGIEQTRLKFNNSNDLEKTEADNYLFIIDCKKTGSLYTPKLNKDFSNIALKGVYDYKNVYNTNMTPLNIILNNANYIKCGLNFTDKTLKITNNASGVRLISWVNGKSLDTNKDIDLTNHNAIFSVDLITLKINLKYLNINKIYKKLLKFETNRGLVYGYYKSVDYKNQTITIIKK